MTKISCQNYFFLNVMKLMEIGWEISPSEDPWFHLWGLWVKIDIPENNIFPGNEDSRQTADLPGSPWSIFG